MINSAKMLLKLKTYDFERILPQIQQWTDSLDNIQVKDLELYYYQTLQPIPQSDKFFIIDKIQKCKLMNSMIYCLIDWKYFAPSKPDKKSNWFEIKQVEQSVIQKYLEDKDNKVQLKELLDQTSEQYKNTIKWIVQIVYEQQQNYQNQQIISIQYEQQIKELKQQIENLKTKLDNMQTEDQQKDTTIKQLQKDQKELKEQQKELLDSLKIVQTNQKQYQKDVLSTINQIKLILEKEEDVECKKTETIVDEQQQQ